MKRIQRARLQYLGLPEINSLEDLSLHTHLSKGLIFRFLENPEKQYNSYTIPKPAGGSRRIHQPSYELKAVQAWILRRVLDQLSTSSASKGFEPNESIVDNARPHIGAKSILCIDIDDFFPSIHAGKVWHVFATIGYSSTVAAMLTSLTTCGGHLPQGAPTSPKLANLVCWKLDKRIMGYASQRRIVYTRYADDITLSSQTDSRLTKALRFVRYIVHDEGFRLNDAKTRYSGPARRHQVTGLVVNDEFVGIGRVEYRRMRAELHNLFTTPNEEVDPIDVRETKGRLAFVHGVDPKRHEKLREYIEGLKSKYDNPPLDDL